MASIEETCGVDEAGRGPWAGPVTAAAVVLDPASPIEGLADSKQLTHLRRACLADRIRERAHAWALGWASAEEIDRLNILRATHLAMWRAVAGLTRMPRLALIDGNSVPAELPCPGDAVIGGDGLVPAISAASILAKTARDTWMIDADVTYPGYGFARHKGYGTRAHAEALEKLGACPLHRRSFKPVARAASRPR